MVIEGRELDLVSYTTVIHGFCKHGLIDKAKQLFVQMKERGISVYGEMHGDAGFWCCMVYNLDEYNSMILMFLRYILIDHVSICHHKHKVCG